MHMRHSIAVMVVMYHMTYKQLRSKAIELDSSEMYRCQKVNSAAK